jgi:NTE family protein
MLNIFKKDSKKGKERYKTGLVLSGGGTRGFAHLGVLKALEEKGIKPDIISGVSAGAIAGVLYADGKKPDDILEMLASQKILDYFDFNIPKTGLIKMNGFEKTLNKHLEAVNFEDLKIPLKVFAVNVNTADYVCFEKGPLSPAIKASSSIPIIFPPVKIGDYYYCDGGTINNFPVEPLLDICDRIIGVSVNPLGNTRKLNNLKQIAERTFHLAIRSHTMDRKNMCDLYIEPEGLEDYGLLELKSSRKIFDLGYKATIKALEEKGWGKE